MEMQSRWKSPVFWVSLVITTLGLITSSGLITSDVTLRIIGVAVGFLSALIGDANNPTNKVGF